MFFTFSQNPLDFSEIYQAFKESYDVLTMLVPINRKFMILGAGAKYALKMTFSIFLQNRSVDFSKTSQASGG